MRKLAGVLLILLAGVVVPSVVIVLFGGPWWLWLLVFSYSILFFFSVVFIADILESGHHSVPNWAIIVLTYLVVPSVLTTLFMGFPWYLWAMTVGLIVGGIVLLGVLVWAIKVGISLIEGDGR